MEAQRLAWQQDRNEADDQDADENPQLVDHSRGDIKAVNPG